MAGMNWRKYLDPESDAVGGVDNAAMTDPNAFPQLDWMDALKVKRMSEDIYSPYKTPFLGAQDQDTQFDPYNQPRASSRNPPQDPFAGAPSSQGTLFNPAAAQQAPAVDWNRAPNQGTLFNPYGNAPTPTRPTEQASSPQVNRGGPVDWARNALNTSFNPTYQNSNAAPSSVTPQQIRAPRPQVSRPASAPRRVASPTGPTGEPIPVQSQPSYTPMEPVDFAGLLSGAAQKGGGPFGDFGARGMLGPEERAAQAAEAQRIANQPKMPEYDYGPMNRYQEYLKAEPDRDQYKPTGWGRVLNAAAAGVQGYNTGDIGQGIKLGEYLNQQPYENAFKKWQSKGTRIGADATMAETRYKNQVEAYNKNADNERADKLARLTERGVEVREAQLLLQTEEALSKGWEKFIKDGKVYLSKMGSNGMQVVATPWEPERLTALQQIGQKEADRAQSNTNSQRSANTSIANTNATINAAGERLGRTLFSQEQRQGNDIASRENLLGRTQTFQAGQNDKTREVTRRGQDLQYPTGGRPVTASNTNTAAGLMSNKYPEFNNDNVVIIRGNKPQLNPKFKSRDEQIKHIATLTKDPEEAKRLLTKFDSMLLDFGTFRD